MLPPAVVEVPRREAPAAQPADSDSDSDSAAVEIEAAEEESDWSSEARRVVPAARIRRNAAASDSGSD